MRIIILITITLIIIIIVIEVAGVSRIMGPVNGVYQDRKFP